MACQGRLCLVKSLDDVSAPVIRTELHAALVEWNNAGQYLCVAGHVPSTSAGADLFDNWLLFYNERGQLRYRAAVPYNRVRRSRFEIQQKEKNLFWKYYE